MKKSFSVHKRKHSCTCMCLCICAHAENVESIEASVDFGGFFLQMLRMKGKTHRENNSHRFVNDQSF